EETGAPADGWCDLRTNAAAEVSSVRLEESRMQLDKGKASDTADDHDENKDQSSTSSSSQSQGVVASIASELMPTALVEAVAGTSGTAESTTSLFYPAFILVYSTSSDPAAYSLSVSEVRNAADEDEKAAKEAESSSSSSGSGSSILPTLSSMLQSAEETRTADPSSEEALSTTTPAPMRSLPDGLPVALRFEKA
ncbi:unnamed protein product, partial [Amoebophrya sp. A25]